MSSLVSYIPSNSFFHRLDPRVKTIFLLIVSTSIFMVDNMAVAAFILAVMIGLWFMARLPSSPLVGILKVLLGIIAFLFVVQAIFYPGTTPLIKPLIPIGRGFGQVTLEGILFSVLLSLRLVAMVIMLPLVTYTTPVQDFALGFVRMGLPYKTAYTITTALNLVSVLQSETTAIVDAQRLRAMQTFENGKLADKLKSYPALVTPLVIGSMRRAQSMAVAMDSRAFGASRSRTNLQDLTMKWSDWAFLVGSIAFAIGVVVVSSLLG